MPSESTSVMNMEERLSTVTSMKLDGDSKMRSGDIEVAYTQYVAAQELLNEADDASSPELHNLSNAVTANLSLACMKLNKHAQCIAECTKILKVNAETPKVLYRRGMSYLHLSEFESARTDFYALKRLGDADADAALALLRSRELQAVEQEKRRYGRLFEDQSGLYDDREKEREVKAAADAEKKDRLEADFEAKKKAGELAAESTFDDYVKDVEDQEKRELVEKQNEISRRALGVRAGSVTHTDELELDEEDRKILEETKKKGYCYFKDTHGKGGTVDAPAEVGSACEEGSVASRGASDWNVSGTTFEEKDTSKWCKLMLQGMLENLGGEGFSVKSIISLQVDGQMVVARGNLRHLYDITMNLDVEFEIDNQKSQCEFLVQDLSDAQKTITEFNLKTKTGPSIATDSPAVASCIAAIEDAVSKFAMLYGEKI